MLPTPTLVQTLRRRDQVPQRLHANTNDCGPSASAATVAGSFCACCPALGNPHQIFTCRTRCRPNGAVRTYNRRSGRWARAVRSPNGHTSAARWHAVCRRWAGRVPTGWDGGAAPPSHHLVGQELQSGRASPGRAKALRAGQKGAPSCRAQRLPGKASSAATCQQQSCVPKHAPVAWPPPPCIASTCSVQQDIIVPSALCAPPAEKENNRIQQLHENGTVLAIFGGTGGDGEAAAVCGQVLALLSWLEQAG